MRRMLSTSVLVHAGPTQQQLQMAALAGDDKRLLLYTPTESEMRDAVAKCTADLNDMFVARGYSAGGWTVDNFDFKPVVNNGDVILMGAMIIRRDH